MSPNDLQKLARFVEELTGLCHEHGFTLKGAHDSSYVEIVDTVGHLPGGVSKISWEGEGFEFQAY